MLKLLVKALHAGDEHVEASGESTSCLDEHVEASGESISSRDEHVEASGESTSCSG